MSNPETSPYQSAALLASAGIVAVAASLLMRFVAAPPDRDRSVPSAPNAANTVNPDVCNGRISNITYQRFSREGNVYRIDNIEGAGCAPIYNPANFRTLGRVTLGDTVLGCTFIEDKPARLHVVSPVDGGIYAVGNVNLSSGGLIDVRAEQVPSCESVGAEEVGFIVSPSPSPRTS